MMLFRIDGQKLILLKETQFDFEKSIQKTTEANLEAVFGLEFVKSEFNLENFWLDTLAFNPETKAFMIIEYKKKQNLNIIDQGSAYLNALLYHKADVLYAYNELKNKLLKMNNIDWSQTRVIFIAPDFSAHQRWAVNPQSPFELWQVTMYGNNLISYNRIPPTPSASTKPVGLLTGPAGKEIRVITREDVVKEWSESQKDALRAIEEIISGLGSDIGETFGKSSISFKTKKSFLQVWAYQKNSLTLNFLEGQRLMDSKKLLRGSGKQAQYIRISSLEQISEINDYLKQAYKNSFQ